MEQSYDEFAKECWNSEIKNHQAEKRQNEYNERKAAGEFRARFDARELLKIPFPPREFLVDLFLPQGVTLLSGSAKLGKSWLVGDMCISIVTGTPFLGFQTKKSSVCYLSIEDDNAGLQDRIVKMLDGRVLPHDTTFDLYIGGEALNEMTGEKICDKLDWYFSRTPDCKLIVIDTLAKVRTACGHNEYSYLKDNQEMGEFCKIADKFGVSIVLVHHNRKAVDERDAQNNQSGTTGLSGGVHTIMNLYRNKRTDKITKLEITGKRARDLDLEITWNDQKHRWEVSSNQNHQNHQQSAVDEACDKVFDLLNKSDKKKWVGTNKELQSIIDFKPNNDLYDLLFNKYKILRRYYNLAHGGLERYEFRLGDFGDFGG